jgi:hypothetical protein
MTYTASVAKIRKPSWIELTNQAGRWRQHPRYQGCVGHWLMTEYGGLTTYDLTGRPLSNGVLTNMDSATDWTLGVHGPQLDFDGSDDYVTLGNATPGDPLDLAKANDSFTILCRFLFTAAPTGGNVRILVKRATGNNAWAYVFGLQVISTTTRLNLQLWNATANPLVNGATALATGTRYSAAAVRDHTAGLLRLYLNGLQDNTGTNNAGNFSLAAATEIARGNVGFTQFHVGTIDEVRIYNRALTAAEVLSWHLEASLEFVEHRTVGVPHAVAQEDVMAAVYAWQQAAEFVGVHYV